MGVTDVIVTILDDVFKVCFLTENNYCILWQILLSVWLMLLPHVD